MDWFSRFMRTSAAPLSLLFIKLFTALRTGLDTLIVLKVFDASVGMLDFINAVIYVSLIDLVFTGLWFYAAYGGDSKQASLLRPYAIAGAWVLYVGMVVVGWAAHPDSPYLALLSRVAGGVALGYDTSSVLGPSLRSIFGFFSDRIKEGNRAKGPEEVYLRTVKRAMVTSINQSAPQMRKQIASAIASRLGELDDVVFEILPTPSDFSDSSDSYRPELESGQHKITDSSDGVVATAIQNSWHTCKQSLIPGEIFVRSRIENCTNLKRSRAADVLQYALEIGEARRIGHSRYLYQPIEQGMVVEDREESETSDPPGSF